jgi:hypothetical protein
MCVVLIKKYFLSRAFIIPAVLSLALGAIVTAPPDYRNLRGDRPPIENLNAFHNAEMVPVDEFIKSSFASRLAGHQAKKQKQSSHGKESSFGHAADPNIHAPGIFLFQFRSSPGLFRPDSPSNKAPPLI